MKIRERDPITGELLEFTPYVEGSKSPDEEVKEAEARAAAAEARVKLLEEQLIQTNKDMSEFMDFILGSVAQ